MRRRPGRRSEAAPRGQTESQDRLDRLDAAHQRVQPGGPLPHRCRSPAKRGLGQRVEDAQSDEQPGVQVRLGQPDPKPRRRAQCPGHRLMVEVSGEPLEGIRPDHCVPSNDYHGLASLPVGECDGKGRARNRAGHAHRDRTSAPRTSDGWRPRGANRWSGNGSARPLPFPRNTPRLGRPPLATHPAPACLHRG